MKTYHFALGMVFAIATAINIPAIALSQNAKNPTHPTLNDINFTSLTQKQSGSGSSAQNLKNPTHPTLSEISSTPSTPYQASPSSASQNLKNPTHPTLNEISQGESQSSSTLFSNGPTFRHPPQLVRAASSQIGGSLPSTYEFTLVVPADAGQSLKAVTIAQAPGLETVRFDGGRSRAFAAGRFAAGPELRLASVGGEQPKDGIVTVVFEQPVQPGNTVTVAVEAEENPNFLGVYEFGITAYPASSETSGQFLGFGRLNFYGNSN